MTSTRWWWVRHAPVLLPKGTIAGRLDCACDVSTPALGALASVLPQDAFWVVTPLQRSAQTAKSLADHGCRTDAVHVEPDLIEQDFGRWEGRSYAELDEEADLRYQNLWADPAGTAPPGGESFTNAAIRMQTAIERLGESVGGGDIVAVAHAGTIRAALGLALDLSPAAMLRLAVDPLSLTRIDAFRPEGWAVIGVNHSFASNPS